MINSHLKKEVEKGVYVVFLLFGKNAENEDVYYYVSVKGNKIESLNEAIKSGDFNIDDFGSIIKSGIGFPDAETKKYMEDHFSFDHSTMNLPTQ